MSSPSRISLLAALTALVTGSVLAACGGSSGSGTSAQTLAAETTTEAPTSTTTTIDPATLPQTDEHPVATGAGFDSRAKALADAIIADDPSKGLPAFFPLAAYKQVKKISDPAADWKNRLIAEYGSDIHAAHAQLGPNASSAVFTGIELPDGSATWVKPGEEYNQLPYWRVYGTKLRFDVNGQTKTVPASSFISWRGQWYIVHLGAIR